MNADQLLTASSSSCPLRCRRPSVLLRPLVPPSVVVVVDRATHQRWQSSSSLCIRAHRRRSLQEAKQPSDITSPQKHQRIAEADRKGQALIEPWMAL